MCTPAYPSRWFLWTGLGSQLFHSTIISAASAGPDDDGLGLYTHSCAKDPRRSFKNKGSWGFLDLKGDEDERWTSNEHLNIYSCLAVPHVGNDTASYWAAVTKHVVAAYCDIDSSTQVQSVQIAHTLVSALHFQFDGRPCRPRKRWARLSALIPPTQVNLERCLEAWRLGGP